VIFKADLGGDIVSHIVALIIALDARSGLLSGKTVLPVELAYACFGASSVFLDFLRNGLRILSLTYVEKMVWRDIGLLGAYHSGHASFRARLVKNAHYGHLSLGEMLSLH